MIEEFYSNLTQKLGEENLKKVQTARIGIAGAGGLGSNLALNLVRVGFTRLTIVDFDRIEPGNLDRQFYFFDQIGHNKVEALSVNLLRINSRLELKVISKKIEARDVLELFGDCDAVAECFDKAEFKSMLVSNLLAMDTFIVAVSGLGGIGASDDIRVHKVKRNLVLIGDLTSDISGKPALSPRVNIAAAKEADAILEHVIGLDMSDFKEIKKSQKRG
ncbi:MAG: sulfur carrier protein ThiS adenylyltransferase ThiF [Candidatus Omnitrophota bacterium]